MLLLNYYWYSFKSVTFLQQKTSVQIPNFGEILILQTKKKFTRISLKMTVTIFLMVWCKGTCMTEGKKMQTSLPFFE